MEVVLVTAVINANFLCKKKKIRKEEIAVGLLKQESVEEDTNETEHKSGFQFFQKGGSIQSNWK